MWATGDPTEGATGGGEMYRQAGICNGRTHGMKNVIENCNFLTLYIHFVTLYSILSLLHFYSLCTTLYSLCYFYALCYN